MVTTKGEADEMDRRFHSDPHVNEQPFTRSLSGVGIPNNIQQVSVRAHDSIHAYGGKVMILDLPLKWRVRGVKDSRVANG